MLGAGGGGKAQEPAAALDSALARSLDEGLEDKGGEPEVTNSDAGAPKENALESEKL